MASIAVPLVVGRFAHGLKSDDGILKAETRRRSSPLSLPAIRMSFMTSFARMSEACTLWRCLCYTMKPMPKMPRRNNLLKAFRNLARFRGDAKFSTWLISIALNEARSRLRSKKNVKIDSLDEAPDGPGHVSPALLRDWREIPSEALERQEVSLLLQHAVTDLPSIYREVFMLRDVEELSVNESAEALGITVASVKVRLHRARIMLQKKSRHN